jgi:hypothetical protein
MSVKGDAVVVGSRFRLQRLALSLIKSIQIEEDRFGVEPEIIAKLARTGCRIYEVGISYSDRAYAEGKKINWKDGVRAIYAIFKYNLKPRRIDGELQRKLAQGVEEEWPRD